MKHTKFLKHSFLFWFISSMMAISLATMLWHNYFFYGGFLLFGFAIVNSFLVAAFIGFFWAVSFKGVDGLAYVGFIGTLFINLTILIVTNISDAKLIGVLAPLAHFLWTMMLLSGWAAFVVRKAHIED